MTQPTPYTPGYNFTQYQTSHPSTPLPAANVDAELLNIASCIAQICINLALLQRDDGALANGSVGPDQISSALTIGVQAATAWASGKSYIAPTSTVYQGNTVYRCAVSHTSSSSFATDLAAGLWTVLLDFTSYVTAAAASATAAAASATAAAAATTAISGTSATSITPGSGAKTFTTQSGLYFNVGSYVMITSRANPTVTFMNAQVTSYSGTSLVVSVQAFGGSGAHTDWNIAVSGPPGATGPAGSPGSGTGDMLGANNLSDVANAATARTNLGLGSAAVQASSFFLQAANNLSDVTALAAFDTIKQAGAEGYAGALQLATVVEATAGADTAKAVTSAGVAAYVTAHPPSLLMTPLGVNSIILAQNVSPNFIFANGTTAAANLNPVSFTTNGSALGSGDSLSGTWKALGTVPRFNCGLFQRTA